MKAKNNSERHNTSVFEQLLGSVTLNNCKTIAGSSTGCSKLREQVLLRMAILLTEDMTQVFPCESSESVGEEVVSDANGVGDNGEGWVDCAAAWEKAGVYHVEIVEVVGFAVDVKDGLIGVGAKAAGSVLVADTFKRNAFFEVGVEGNGAFGVTGLLEDVDPAGLKTGEGFNVVVGVGELDLWRAVGAGVEGDAIVGVGKVFGH